MSEPNEVSRRELLRAAAASIALGSAAGAEAAQHAHHTAAEEKKSSGGVYKPKYFNAQEYRTIQRLTDLILPADERSKGALEAGAPEFIDLLSSRGPELAALWTGGLAWLDREMVRRHGTSFADAAGSQQTAMLDRIAYRKNDTPELGPGILFFDLARRMTVDAYCTSAIGVADLGYKGNVGMTTFQVPTEALTYALKKSGLG
jgi:hypothetical protein